MSLCGDAPDTSGINEAAKSSAELGKEALAWYKQMYETEAPARADAAARANRVSDSQITAMDTATAQARDIDAYQKRVFQPLEKSIVQDATTFDSEAYREAQAGKAQADVAGAFSRARDDQAITAQRMGISPESGRYVAASAGMATDQAMAEAGAKNKARTDATALAGAKKMDAASLGRGLGSAQATQLSASQGSGQIAASTGLAALQPAQQAQAQMGNGFNMAMNGMSNAGNLYSQAASIQQKAGDNSGLWQGLGSVAGSMIIRSDVNAKKGFMPVDPDAALEAVKDTPVSSWAYKEAAGDAPRHVGPMAQHVAASMGMDVAPGGKKIDVGTLTGVTMAATQALDSKVERLTDLVGKVAAAAGFNVVAPAKAQPGARPAAAAGM